MLIRQRVKLQQLFVSNHIACWIRRPGDANHPGFFANMQMLKIDVVFKLAFRQQFNIRTRRDKQIFFQPGVSVANVFRCQREQHFFDPTIGTASGKQIK